MRVQEIFKKSVYFQRSISSAHCTPCGISIQSVSAEEGEAMKIYLAGPIFSEADQEWLLRLKIRIEEFARSKGKKVEVIWPYELIDRLEIESLGELAKQEIFDRCRSNLDRADLLIALLDGSQVDDGTAWEVGYFFSIRDRSKIIGIRTDFRRAGETGTSVVNAMIETSCGKIIKSVEELMEVLSEML